MRSIGFAEGDALLTWTAVADAIEAGHRRPRARIGDLLLGQSANSLLSRAAWIEGLGIAMKSMSVFPGNASLDPPLPTVQGGMLLFDAETGTPAALIDGILVTKWKTAGDSVLGARLLARPDSQTLLICGAGTVARSLVDAYREIFPGLDRVLLWNRNAERAAKLASELSLAGQAVEAAADLPTALGSADIVACATMATEPFLKGDWVRPGTHVDLIGAYRPDMREADDALLRRGELFVDARETTLGHIGEIDHAIASGAITKESIRGDLYDLCNGAPGRSGPEAVTVFKNGGGAHLDLMVGDLVQRLVATAA